MNGVATQRRFDLRIDTARPLFGINAAMGLLSRNEDDILYMIEEGVLPWSFDIRTPGASKAEWRIWCRCIADALAGRQSTRAMDLSEVIESIVPGKTEVYLTRRRITEVLNCGHDHVGRLAAARELVPLEDSPSYGQRIERASVAAFLARRRGEVMGGNNKTKGKE